MKRRLFLLSAVFLMSGWLNAYSIGPNNFYKTIRSKRVVLVKFWASWCAPCSILKPEFEKAKKIIGNRALLVEYNIDLGGDVLRRYQVKRIPTMILFVNGKEVERSISVLGYQDIVDWVLGYVPVN